MKIYMKLKLATCWLSLVEFTELNISEFLFLNFDYMSYHWEILKNIIINGSEIYWNFNSNDNFFPVG